MSTFHSAKYGTAIVGSNTASTELPTISWSVQETQDHVQFRNSKTGRNTVAETTFIGLNATIVYDWPYDANPLLPANGGLSITNGGTMAARLYVGGTTPATNSAYWDIPAGIVMSNSQSMSVEGKLQNTLSLMATGAFTEPAT